MALLQVLLTAVSEVALLVAGVIDQTPEDEDVKAGWTAFALFLMLIVAVALLGWSLTRQLRKAQAAQDAGLYGSDAAPAQPAGPAQGTASEPR